MYSWLQSVWVDDAPEADEAALLPDWLRLSLVRSARPALLDAGLRGLPAHKLALFIQTFGMPVASMRSVHRSLSIDVDPRLSLIARHRLNKENNFNMKRIKF